MSENFFKKLSDNISPNSSLTSDNDLAKNEQ